MPAPTLIFIHCRGKKPPIDQERKLWLDALNEGLLRLNPATRQFVDDPIHLRIAYWSDCIYPLLTLTDTSQVPTTVGIVDPAPASLAPDQMSTLSLLVDKFWGWRLGQPAPPAVTPPDPQTKQCQDGYVRDVIKFFCLGYGNTCARPLHDELIAVE
jgi:hypothetical protein